MLPQAGIMCGLDWLRRPQADPAAIGSSVVLVAITRWGHAPKTDDGHS
jgi:hypothetical protein